VSACGNVSRFYGTQTFDGTQVATKDVFASDLYSEISIPLDDLFLIRRLQARNQLDSCLASSHIKDKSKRSMQFTSAAEHTVTDWNFDRISNDVLIAHYTRLGLNHQ
jgi:hypothetical protein